MHTCRLLPLVGLFAAMSLLAQPAPAWAQGKDFCISWLGIVNYAAKKFKLPKPGQCAPFQGYCANTACVQPNTITGSACVSDDGTKAMFALAVMLQVPGAPRVLDTIQLNLPTFTGTWRQLLLQTTGNSEFGPFDVTAAACTAPPMP